MPVRDNIVNAALWEASWGSWRPDGEEMTKFFENVGLSPPTANDLKKFAGMISNVPVNGISTAWCGIFACHVLKHWGGLDVKWVLGKGIVGKAVKKVWDYRFMQPGDVAVIRNKADSKGNFMHHHFIVTQVDYAANTLQFVEGNGDQNSIHWRTDRKVNQSSSSANHLKRPYAYYQIVG